jgi:hypothetical protein
MHDQYKQKWLTDVIVVLLSYKVIHYVHVVNIKFRTALVKFRVSSHNLMIETGRYDKVERNNRISCTCCDQNVVENEYRFLLVCPA